MYLAVAIAATDTAHIPQVRPVHSNQEIELAVILFFQLTGCFAAAADPMLGQLPAGRGINWIANLLGAGSCGRNVKLLLQSSLPHQILHHKLRHRTAAYVAVADKEYLCQLTSLVFASLYCYYTM